MLQSLLQPRENQRSKMIGAMPAVAVRHERRRNEKRSTGGTSGGGGGGGRRPSQLPLQLGRPGDPDATPSPDTDHRFRNELYVCGKVAMLHAIVGALLLGIVVLVVGLVQLSPGAEAAQHRYYLMGAGAALTGGGVIAAVLRCICLHWFNRKYGGDAEVAAAAHKPHGHGHGHGHAGGGGAVSLVEAAHTHGHAAHTQGHAPSPRDKHKAEPKADHKPKLKAQASVTHEPAPAPALAPAAPAGKTPATAVV